MSPVSPVHAHIYIMFSVLQITEDALHFCLCDRLVHLNYATDFGAPFTAFWRIYTQRFMCNKYIYLYHLSISFK